MPTIGKVTIMMLLRNLYVLTALTPCNCHEGLLFASLQVATAGIQTSPSNIGRTFCVFMTRSKNECRCRNSILPSFSHIVEDRTPCCKLDAVVRALFITSPILDIDSESEDM